MRWFGVETRRPSRGRFLVVLMAVLAMLASLGSVSSAQAAAKATAPLPALSTAKTAAVASHGFAAVAPTSLALAVRAPAILLKPSTAIGAETVKVTGKLPTAKSRPILVQRKSGTRWVTVAKARTSRTGSYATSFRAPAPRSYTIRTLAPRVRVAGRIRAQVVTSTRTLKVVAQAASLSIPTSLKPLTLSTATLTFRPVRAGRAVALQIWRSGTWATLATSRQSAVGTANLAMRAGLSGSYAYRAQTAAAAGAPVYSSLARFMKVTPAADTTAPGKVTGLTDDNSASSDSVTLRWTNPVADFAGVTIRRAEGTLAPAKPGEGTFVAELGATANSYTDSMLAHGTKYTYAIFAHDSSLNHAPAAVITIETVADPGELTGHVTDADANYLENVQVTATDVSSGDSYSITTTVNGLWSMDLPPADYKVCFVGGLDVTGGSSVSGYADECYDNQGVLDPPNLVTVVSTLSTTLNDVVLTVGGTLTGTVTEFTGGQGLANVDVFVMSSLITGGFLHVTTTGDGSYTVAGLVAGTDYTVCFTAASATGGSHIALGYVGQCYNDQPTGPPTPVIVTTGTPTAGINAALISGGAISGKVTDSVDALKGLGGVFVMAWSASGGDGYGEAYTAADGSYSVKGLPAGTDYTVCFGASESTGGPGTFGYGSETQCYLEADGSTSVSVPVSLGAETPDISLSLVQLGAVSGKVTDAAHPLTGMEGVIVTVESDITGDIEYGWTEADGTYMVKNLAAGTDYTVCFAYENGDVAYVAQCYDNQPDTGLPTPVTVTLGAARGDTDAVLVPVP